LRSEHEGGSADADSKELQSLLEKVLIGQTLQEFLGVSESVENSLRSPVEVLRLRVRVAMDEEVRTAVCRSLVQVGGVVSVTFETEQIVVRVRAAELLGDPLFVEEICTTVEEQLLQSGACGGLEREPALVVPEGLQRGKPLELHEAKGRIHYTLQGLEPRSTDSDPEYLDDDDDVADADTRCMDKSCASGGGSHSDFPLESDDEPAYLDDSEDEAAEVGPDSSQASSLSARLGTSWSFFSHTGFFTGHRLQEYEDDPRIIARLRRANLRLERRRNEDQMRLRRVLSVITPLRTGTMADAAKRAEALYEIPGVE